LSDYINPLGLDSIILSATELEKGANLTTDSQEAFSVNVNLAPPGSSSNLMTFPLVQGMGFITATYTSATLLIKSGLFFKQLSPVTTVGPSYRWIALLNDGHEWAIYVTPSGNTKPTLTLSSDGSTLQGPGGFSGLVQIAKIENQGEELIYDLQAGVYATSCSLSADNIGAYSLSWQKSGNMSKSLLMFALPHHMETFSQNTLTQVLNITLQTPTKGNATAVLADQWFLAEQLPTSMGFAPWTPTITNATLSDAAKQVIGPVLTSELGQDMIAQTDLTSIYFSGKAFAKFASLVYTAHDLVGNTGLAGAALLRLEDAFGKFVSNTANSTLTYDNDWKGIINSAGYTDPNADFGNPSYNDHMFHYGYFVYTAAVIAYLDPAWLAKDSNKDWVDSLIRDYANPVDNDPYFPFSRNFDWYHGHSWAGGLYDSGDGKGVYKPGNDLLPQAKIMNYRS
jgi:endo-1,3(4)-beta-glucanase